MSIKFIVDDALLRRQVQGGVMSHLPKESLVLPGSDRFLAPRHDLLVIGISSIACDAWRAHVDQAQHIGQSCAVIVASQSDDDLHTLTELHQKRKFALVITLGRWTPEQVEAMGLHGVWVLSCINDLEDRTALAGAQSVGKTVAQAILSVARAQHEAHVSV